ALLLRVGCDLGGEQRGKRAVLVPHVAARTERAVVLREARRRAAQDREPVALLECRGVERTATGLHARRFEEDLVALAALVRLRVEGAAVTNRGQLGTAPRVRDTRREPAEADPRLQPA